MANARVTELGVEAAIFSLGARVTELGVEAAFFTINARVTELGVEVATIPTVPDQGQISLGLSNPDPGQSIHYRGLLGRPFVPQGPSVMLSTPQFHSAGDAPLFDWRGVTVQVPDYFFVTGNPGSAGRANQMFQCNTQLPPGLPPVAAQSLPLQSVRGQERFIWKYNFGRRPR